jgi:hypothetical protein
MMASLAGDGDRFTFTVRFSMFGAFWLAFLIATLSQFAINDGNYYEAVNAAQNLFGGWRRWRRYHTCLLLAGCGALAGWIVNYKVANAWYAVPVFLANHGAVRDGNHGRGPVRPAAVARPLPAGRSGAFLAAGRGC